MRTARATAAACLLSLAAFACSDGRPPLEPPPPAGGSVSVAGQVFALGGGAPQGLRVTLDGTQRVSVPLQPDGSFTIQGTTAGDSVDVIIDVPAGAARTTLPALVRVPVAAAPTNLRVLLIPTRWTIDGGSYSGTTVDVSLEAAFRLPCSTAGDTNCDGFFPMAWASGIKVWPATSLPARLAFDHARSHVVITAADSVRFWNIVSRMNAEAGLQLFRPARADEIAFNGDSPTNGVVIRVDTTLAGFGAWANWWWNAAGDMYAGRIRVRTLAGIGSSSLMTHELLHTQGMKHSCSWATVMGGYGCTPTTNLSPQDVAYFQLARRVLERQRESGIPHALIPALQGERVAMLNLPLFPFAAGKRAQTLGSDSIGDHWDGAAHRH